MRITHWITSHHHFNPGRQGRGQLHGVFKINCARVIGGAQDDRIQRADPIDLQQLRDHVAGSVMTHHFPRNIERIQRRDGRNVSVQFAPRAGLGNAISLKRKWLARQRVIEHDVRVNQHFHALAMLRQPRRFDNVSHCGIGRNGALSRANRPMQRLGDGQPVFRGERQVAGWFSLAGFPQVAQQSLQQLPFSLRRPAPDFFKYLGLSHGIVLAMNCMPPDTGDQWAGVGKAMANAKSGFAGHGRPAINRWTFVAVNRLCIRDLDEAGSGRAAQLERLTIWREVNNERRSKGSDPAGRRSFGQ